MSKKIRRGTQLSLLNPRRAGRKAKHDRGIRHTSRPKIKKAILRARKQGLKVIHFTLEWDHVHLLIEADNNLELAKGMKAFGVQLL